MRKYHPQWRVERRNTSFIVLVGSPNKTKLRKVKGADGAGPCGRASPDEEAMKMAPCAMAAQDEKATVSGNCCLQVKKIGQNLSCLCAVTLSDTAKSSGIKPEVAMTIPKRCNLPKHPVWTLYSPLMDCYEQYDHRNQARIT
ncbi:uncharacterized protein LOC132314682 [Cornus florida]|uniref:uncharacterized protein LOC132314682 n=1 Tax=Cornus florida TaxID=4283 RepID=UPI00289A5982|nr:uncharacterized protein LOC132314682 [Cornus florida]